MLRISKDLYFHLQLKLIKAISLTSSLGESSKFSMFKQCFTSGVVLKPHGNKLAHIFNLPTSVSKRYMSLLNHIAVSRWENHFLFLTSRNSSLLTVIAWDFCVLKVNLKHLTRKFNVTLKITTLNYSIFNNGC